MGELNKESYGQTAQTRRASKFYFRPALTFPNRSVTFSTRWHPANYMFSMRGPAIIPLSSPIAYLMGFFNSRTVRALIQMQTASQTYTTGVLKELRWVDPDEDTQVRVSDAALQLFQISRRICCRDELDPFFVSPVEPKALGNSFCDLIQSVRHEHENNKLAIDDLQKVINDSVAELHGITDADIARCERADQETETADLSWPTPPSDRLLAHAVIQYGVGCSFGRYDLRFSSDLSRQRPIPSVTDSAPAVQPGGIASSNSLPIGFQRNAHEHRTHYPDSPGHKLATEPEYSKNDQAILKWWGHIAWDGILVDDAGHPRDILAGVRFCLDNLWGEGSAKAEQELCQARGVRAIREYLAKPSIAGFWQEHVRCYSKHSRSAPIYWLLQSSKKNYALWLYYHRLDKDMLFKALNNYVEPKIRLEANGLDSLRAEKQAAGEHGKGSKKLDKEIERQEEFVSELRDFADKLGRAARLDFGDTEKLDSSVTYDPDLNDGVVLNIAPLHELVSWKEARTYWDALLKGEYDWSSIGTQLRRKGLVE